MGDRFRRQIVLDNDEKAGKYVQIEIREALSTICRTLLQDNNHLSAPQSVAPLSTEPAEHFAEQLLQTSSDAVNVCNAGQRHVLDELVKAVMPEFSIYIVNAECLLQLVHDHLIFVDAPGVTSRTFVTSAIQRILRPKGMNEVTVASSGADAQKFYDERTANYTVQITIPLDQDCTCNDSSNSLLVDELRRTDVIMQDEIFISHRHNV